MNARDHMRDAEIHFNRAVSHGGNAFPLRVRAAWDASKRWLGIASPEQVVEIARVMKAAMIAYAALPSNAVHILAQTDQWDHPQVTARVAAQKTEAENAVPALAEFAAFRAKWNERLAESLRAENDARHARNEQCAPAELLTRLRSRGIDVRAKGGTITMQAGATLDGLERDAVRRYKPAILALLTAEHVADERAVLA